MLRSKHSSEASVDLPEEELIAFLEECAGQLEEAESALMSLEEEFDLAQVNLVFRMVHSVKGGAGFFALNQLKHLAHDLESALDQMRSGSLAPSPELISLLLRGLDRLKEMVLQGKASEQTEIQDLIFELQNYLGKSQNSVQGNSPSHHISLDLELLQKHLPWKADEWAFKWIYAAQLSNVDDELVHVLATVGEPIGALDSEQLSGACAQCWIFASVMEKDLVEVLLPQAQISVLRNSQNQWQIPLSSPSISTPSQTPLAKIAEPTTPAKEKSESSKSAGEGTLRISVTVLENLMNLAGELVLSRNQLLNSVSTRDFHQIKLSSQRISQVTTELQESIMQTRMQPLGALFQRFPRLVRDLAKQLSKDVQIEIEGKDVEVDKAIIEGLADPLTHMVRNSMDHGLENPEQRLSAGKSPTGTVSLKAWHEAGQVVIELSDNGRGIAGDKVAQKALEKGLIKREDYDSMSFAEKVALIFMPGLSTAEQISDVSGRGVGMDVVKANIEKLGGKIDIKTELGLGSSFKIRLPLTLAIIPSLLVESGRETFAIPQANVCELVRIPADQVKSKVYQLGESQVLDLRGELIPLIRLDQALKLPLMRLDAQLGWQLEQRQNLADRRSPHLDLESKPRELTGPDRRQNFEGALQIAVVDAGGFRYGLVVARLNDTQEIVVKPLELWARDSKEYAGATILGNGKIALIIDVSGLAHILGIHRIAEQVRHRQIDEETESDHDLSSAQLIFQSSPGEYCALSTQDIIRIEPLNLNQVEFHRGQRIARIQGRLLNLVSPAELGLGEFSGDQELVALVLCQDQQEFGFMAARPLDVLPQEMLENFDLHLGFGVEKTQLIRGRTTLVLNTQAIFETLNKQRQE